MKGVIAGGDDTKSKRDELLGGEVGPFLLYAAAVDDDELTLLVVVPVAVVVAVAAVEDDEDQRGSWLNADPAD